jgi:hypothetical protein
MDVQRRAALTGTAAGLLVLLVVVPPAYVFQSGSPVGTLLTVLACSPVGTLVAGGVACRQTREPGGDDLRTAVRRGLVAGGMLGVLPALGIGYVLGGVAQFGGGFSAFGLALTVVVVLTVPLIAGVVGGLGGAVTRIVGGRPQQT